VVIPTVMGSRTTRGFFAQVGDDPEASVFAAGCGQPPDRHVVSLLAMTSGGGASVFAAGYGPPPDRHALTGSR